MTSICQVMTKPVVSVSPDSSVADTVEFLTRHHIGGVPVVNERGELVGMISELALIDVVFDESVRSRLMYTLWERVRRVKGRRCCRAA